MNEGIKRYAREMRVPLWEIAAKLGISESTMTRMMRQEISEEKATEIRGIVSEIARKRVM